MLEIMWFNKLALHVQGEPSTGSLLNALHGGFRAQAELLGLIHGFVLGTEALLHVCGILQKMQRTTQTPSLLLRSSSKLNEAHLPIPRSNLLGV